jgi:hypothetical protein
MAKRPLWNGKRWEESTGSRGVVPEAFSAEAVQQNIVHVLDDCGDRFGSSFLFLYTDISFRTP